MIELHGQEAWDTAVAERAAAQEAAASAAVAAKMPKAHLARRHDRGTDRRTRARRSWPHRPDRIGRGRDLHPSGHLILAVARGVSPGSCPIPLIVGGGGRAGLLLRHRLHRPADSPGATFLILAIPTILALYGVREAFMARLARNDLCAWSSRR
jgi:hypothetical protein